MSNETEMKDNVREDVYDKELFDRLLDQNDIDEFRKEFLELHNYEQSEYFEDTDDGNRQKIFEFLSPKEVANFFDQLDFDDDDYESLFDNMDATYASHVLEEMSYDNSFKISTALSAYISANILAA